MKQTHTRNYPRWRTLMAIILSMACLAGFTTPLIASTIVAWGENGDLQATVPGGLGGVTAISAGLQHSMALKSDGKVVAWGWNSDGQCDVPAGLSDVMAISAGSRHSVALRSNGTVVVWGASANGQTSMPNGLSGVTAIAAGGLHTLVLKNDGTVVAWGDNVEDQSIVPGNLSDVTAIAAGFYHSLALKSDGTVVAWGSTQSDQAIVPGGLSGVTAIAAGLVHSLALKSDGTVVAWGSNAFGQRIVPAGLSGVTAVSGGNGHNLALKSDGTVVAWGSNNQGQTNVPGGLSGVKAIAAGGLHNLVFFNASPSDILLSSASVLENQPVGTVTAILSAVDTDAVDVHTFTLVTGEGDTDNGSFTILGNMLQTAAIFDHETKNSYSIRVRVTDSGGLAFDKQITITVNPLIIGKMVAWGGNFYGQRTVPGGLTEVTASDAGGEHNLALMSDGTVVAWGNNASGQTNVPGSLSGVLAVSGGGMHSLALKSDGTVVAWGSNGLGQRIVPEGLSGVTVISAGSGHNLALKSDGTVVAWGRNDDGQCNVPAGLSGVIGIAAGSTHSLALKSDGKVVAWGDNDYGQRTVPGGLSGVTAIAAGHFHSLALKSDGTVVAWGRNDDGQRTVPGGLSGVTAIAAGGYFSLAVKSDGTVVAWGSNSHGQRNVPSSLRGAIAVSGGYTHSLALRVEPIVITAQPATQDVAIHASATLSVSVTGHEPVYQWRRNGDDIADATSSSLLIPDFQLSDAARYDVVITNFAGAVTSDSAWLFVSAAETNLPSVTITSPKSNERITNDLNITISGKARDTGLGVAQVFVSVNGGAYELADGTTAWTIPVSVNPGLNNIQVKALDFANNESKVISRNFYAVIFSELSLSINGSGSAIGLASSLGTPADEAMLEVGRAYTIIAIPDAGNILTNWTGSITSEALKLTFTMQSNMVLNANFIANPFLPASGIYNGLFSGDEVNFASAGYVRMKVTAKQRLSGRVFVDGNAISFSGKLNIDGTATMVTKARMKNFDKPELTVTVAVDFENQEIIGTLSDGDWTSDILAHRFPWTLENPATTYTNTYTMILTNGTSGPVGSGYAAAKVLLTGKTRFAGHAADGVKIRQSTMLSSAGDWPLFTPMYPVRYTNNLDKVKKVTKGFVMGWLSLQDNALTNKTPVGEVHWIKTGWTNSTYASGFTNTVNVTGSRWLPPVKKSGERAIEMTHALLSFSAGDLGAPFDATYFVTTNTTLAVIKPAADGDYPHTLKASLAAKTGLIKGTFVHPENTTLKTKWFGAMLQDQNYGEGSFMGSTNGGKVTLNAVEEN